MGLTSILNKINIGIWTIIIVVAFGSIIFKIFKSKFATDEQEKEKINHDLVGEAKTWIIVIGVLAAVEILSGIAIQTATSSMNNASLGALSFLITAILAAWQALTIVAKIGIGIKTMKLIFATDEQAEEQAKRSLFSEVKNWILIIGVVMAIGVLLGVVQSMAM